MKNTFTRMQKKGTFLEIKQYFFTFFSLISRDCLSVLILGLVEILVQEKNNIETFYYLNY